jgi:NUDIX domain
MGWVTMPHLHELMDFAVVALVVHQNRVLLIYHKQLQRLHKWLPLGGHLELDENPEQALFREIIWFWEAELHDPVFGIQPDFLFYACEAWHRMAEA